MSSGELSNAGKRALKELGKIDKNTKLDINLNNKIKRTKRKSIIKPIFITSSILFSSIIILTTMEDSTQTLKERDRKLGIASQLFDIVGKAANNTKDLLSSATQGVIGNSDNTYEDSVISGTNVSEGLNINSVTDVQKKMVKEVSDIMTKAAAAYDMPVWALYSIAYFEGSRFTNGSIKIPTGIFKESEYGTTHPTTGKIINYTNYGTAEATADNRLESGNYIGPFQLTRGNTVQDGNGDGIGDVYNFADAALSAANHANNKLKALKNYFPSNVDETSKWMAVAGSYNSGEGAFRKRYPSDSMELFFSQLPAFREPALVKTIADGYHDVGRGGPGLIAIIKELDKSGWNTDSDVRSRNGLSGYQWVSDLMDRNKTGNKYPATNDGVRSPNGGNLSSNVSGGIAEFFAFEHNGIANFMINNRQNMEYLMASYAIGTRLRDNISFVNNGGVIPQGATTINGSPAGQYGKQSSTQMKTYYNWEVEQLNRGIAEEDLSYPVDGMKMEGSHGEVGYKGNFPIFIQSSSINAHSAMPWKFTGNTTLGASGCSMFVIKSMIHGAGYENMPIPNIPTETPTWQALVTAMPRGPLISNNVKNDLGYYVSTLPTGTDQELDALWESVSQGIPYAINVNSKTVTAYDKDLNPKSTKFTGGGHFILLVGAYEMGGVRYVEVVQSTNSRAGNTTIDQNKMIFDFDEMKAKGVIRSSSGGSVPAYTIVGGPGLPTPLYMQANYKPPTRINQISPGVKIEAEKEDIIIDLYNIQ